MVDLVYSFYDIGRPFFAWLFLTLPGPLDKFLYNVVELVFLLFYFLLLQQLVSFTLAKNLEQALVFDIYFLLLNTVYIPVEKKIFL